MTVLPSRMALLSSTEVSQTMGRMRSAKASYSARMAWQVEFAIDAEGPGDDDLFFHHGIVLRAEELRVEEVGDADAAARGLVFVAGADAARSGADGDACLRGLRTFSPSCDGLETARGRGC